jgi:hypothetical protein
MKPPVHDASARQHSGGPSCGLGANDCRKDPLQGLALVEIAGLVGQSTQKLRRVWRTFYHTGPPLGLSRDLIIRGLADKLQHRAHGGRSRALQRRLLVLAEEFETVTKEADPCRSATDPAGRAVSSIDGGISHLLGKSGAKPDIRYRENV